MARKTSRSAAEPGAADETGAGRKTFYVGTEAAAEFDAAVNVELHTRALNPAAGLMDVKKHEIVAAFWRIAVKHRDELDAQLRKDRKRADEATTRDTKKG